MSLMFEHHKLVYNHVLSYLLLGIALTGNAQTSLPLPPLSPPAGKVESRYLSVAEVKAKHEWEIERRIIFPKLVRGNPKKKQIALTFDDGPHPEFTLQILSILKKEEVKATFFVIGKMVDRHPELVVQEAAEGHEVANHTYNHIRLPTLTEHGIARELKEGAKAIERALGHSTKLYRPPGGEYDDDVIAVTKRLGLVMTLWTDDPGDYANPGELNIEKRTLRKVSGGGIILLHDGVQETIDVLPIIIKRLKSKGYSFVTCSEMALEPGVITTGGPRVDPPSHSKRR